MGRQEARSGVWAIEGDHTGNNGIIREIRSSGRVTFARYMELALYHPVEGYYLREGDLIGAAGDFYTSPDVTPLFGKVLADQMAEMWSLAGRPGGWTLLEFGAGKGLLARDLLQHTAEKHPVFHQALEYLIIDQSPAMVRRQEEMLSGVSAPGGGIRWLPGLKDLPGGITGCIFSNELLDAFPVHRLVRCGGRTQEIYVTWENGGLREVTGEPSCKELLDYLSDTGADLEEGQQVEINLALRGWLEKVARYLNRGFLLTIDYGDTAGRLHSPERPNGTIRAYSKHRLADLYQNPGCQDLTANVNFSDLFRWGEDYGLKQAGYAFQMYFLLNLGILEYLEPQGQGFDLQRSKETMAVKKLVMPEGMGTLFKVAVQYKGFDQKPELAGYYGKYGARG